MSKLNNTYYGYFHRLCIVLVIITGALTSAPMQAKGREDVLKIKSDFFAQRLKDPNAGVVSKVAFLDSLLSDKGLDMGRRKELLSSKGNLLYVTGNFPKSIDAFEILLANPDYNLTPAEKLDIQTKLGNSYFNAGKYDRGIEVAYDVIMAEKRPELAKYDVLAYLVLDNIYMRLGRNDISRRNLDNAMEMLSNIKVDEDTRNILLSRIHLRYSSHYVLDGEYDKAFKEIETARKYKVTPELDLFIDTNLALIYMMIHEPRLALHICRKIQANPLKHWNKAVAMNNYADILRELGQYDQALAVCDSNLVLIRELNLSHVLGNLYEIKAEIYGCKGLYDKAFLSLKQAKAIEDSLFNNESEIHINEMSEKFTKFQIVRDKMSLEKTSRRKSLFISILSFLIIIVASVAAWLFVRTRRNKAHKEELEEKIESSHDDMENKNRELTSYALRLAHIDEVLNKIASEAEGPEKNVSDRMTHIQGLIRSLDLKKKGWDTFLVYFEQIHKDFFRNLYARHPDLSKGEIRMCAFILMNLRTKEIAELTSRSVRTVENTRYKLGRKMNLSEGTSLTEYLRSLAEVSPTDNTSKIKSAEKLSEE